MAIHIAVGLKVTSRTVKGYPTTKRELRAKPSTRKGKLSQKKKFVRELVREVCYLVFLLCAAHVCIDSLRLPRQDLRWPVCSAGLHALSIDFREGVLEVPVRGRIKAGKGRFLLLAEDC